MNRIKGIGLGLAFSLVAGTMVQADDTELYVVNLSSKFGHRPKVLIIFDNSGSMASEIEVKQSYDPNVEYEAVGADHSQIGRASCRERVYAPV